MKTLRRKGAEARVELQMTAMIDVVFQLLIFFMLSFKIMAVEGEFNIKPAADATTASPLLNESLPLRLRLTADDGGQLAKIQLNDLTFQDWPDLHRYIVQLVRPDANSVALPSAWEVVLDTDPHLRYEHIVAAITAVHGHVNDAGDILPLVQNIHFAPRR